MRRSRKALVAVATTGTLAVGGLGFAAIGMPVTSSAQTTSTATSSSSSSTAPARDPLSTALQKLVANRTLTQAQADAVQQAVRAEVGNRPFPGPGRHGEAPGLDAAAKAIGISTSELRTQLRDGKTIADVAKAQGVDVSRVVAAMVSDARSHLDRAVANGRLTQARADRQKAQLTQRITDLVNNEPRHDGGPGAGPGGPPSSDAQSSTTS